MKLVNIILLSLSVAFLIIGVHQVMTVGFGEAYWILMLSVLCFLLQGFLKKR